MEVSSFFLVTVFVYAGAASNPLSDFPYSNRILRNNENNLQGEWEEVANWNGGMRELPTFWSGNTWIFSGDSLFLYDGKGTKLYAKTHLKKRTRPPQIDFLMVDGWGGVSMGIYSVHGDFMLLAYDRLSADKRPLQFIFNRELGVTVRVLQRIHHRCKS